MVCNIIFYIIFHNEFIYVGISDGAVEECRSEEHGCQFNFIMVYLFLFFIFYFFFTFIYYRALMM
jgi:hypothetical protein